MRLHLDSEIILRSATRLALRLNASSVDVDHLLLCDLQDNDEAVEIRDIPFDSGVKNVLEAAAELVHREESTIIRPRHLQLALSSHTGLSPEWGVQRQRILVYELVDRALASTLEYKGVDMESLRVQLQGLTVRECRPGPEFISSPAGQRFSEIAGKLATKKNAVLTLLLLSYLLCEGPAAGPFLRAGLTEELLVGILEEHPDELRRPTKFTFDFSLLGVEADRLDLDARHALEVAWILREGAALQGKDILRGLVSTSDPMEEINVHHLLTKIVGHEITEALIRDKRFAGPLSPVTLAPEVHRVLKSAALEAGPIGPINSFHLLVGLAETNEETLHKKGVTPQKIRKHLT